MKHAIGVIDIGLGNVNSLKNVIEFLGYKFNRINNHNDLAGVRKIILPGVGHYSHGVNQLKKYNLFDPLKEFPNNPDNSLLGICLGMQLLCKNSDESPQDKGLNLINASVVKFKQEKNIDLIVPHVGWNEVIPKIDNPLFDLSDEKRFFYFVHSYFVEIDDSEKGSLIAETNHGINFCSAFKKDNIFGVQFHPEKSHTFGLNLLQRFFEY